jgi:c-di-GMP-binding flagellar brake protein YcgR
MRRLRDGQLVSLEVKGLESNLECLVLAVEADEAILEPVYTDYARGVPVRGASSTLMFEHQSRLVMLRGRVQRDGDGKLHFGVTDRLAVSQRRRYARVEASLPAVLRPLDARGSPLSAHVQVRTHDVSADGLLVEAQISPNVARLRLWMCLPDDSYPIECDVAVVRQIGFCSALRYLDMTEADRERLRDFVARAKRAQLERRRVLRWL